MNDVTDPLLIDLAKAAYTDPAARDALHDYWEDRGGQPLLLDRATAQQSVTLWLRVLAGRRREGPQLADGVVSAVVRWVNVHWPDSETFDPVLFNDATFTADLTLNQTVLRQTVGDFRAPIPTYRGGP